MVYHNKEVGPLKGRIIRKRSFLILVPLTPLIHYCTPRARIHNISDLYIPLQKRCIPLSDYTNHD